MAVAYRSDTGVLVVVGGTGQQSQSFVSTQPSAGDLVVSGGAGWNAAAWSATVSDNQSNTYSRAVGIESDDGDTSEPYGGSEPVALIHYCPNVASSGTFTARWQWSASDTEYMTVGAVAFSGAATSSPLDVTASNYHAASARSSTSSGTTGTTAQADAVAVSALALSANDEWGPFTTTGWTQISDPGLPGLGGGIAYKILSATGTQELTWTYNTTTTSDTNHAACIVVLKGAAGVALAWIKA
jgi:hypothetical protein